MNKLEYKWTTVIFIVALFLITNGCKKDPEIIIETVYVHVDTCIVDSIETVEPETIAIGNEYEGGLIFYVDESGEHGLVCSVNIIAEAVWGCEGTGIPGADETVLGSGDQNSIDIMNACSTDDEIHAAFHCLTYGAGGFDDWYLPSKDEMNEIYFHRGELSSTSSDFNGPFWTSSEINDGNAWVQNFSDDGAFSAAPKNIAFSVRAIRSF